MHKKVFGAQRQQLLDWLATHWLSEGPPICFIQGSPGVGKTALAADLCEVAKREGTFSTCFEEVTSRPDPSLTDLFIDLAANLSSHCHLPDMEAALLTGREMNLPRALDRALRNKVLIVIDDIQRLFKNDTGEPIEEVAAVLSSIGSIRGHQGRLLLLSDRLLEQGRWSTDIPIKKLDELEVDDAVGLLEDRLSDAKIPDAVEGERKTDLVQALGRNPRAIETLVSTLAFESLDDVIGRHPGFWSVEDRSVSRGFLLKLEKDLLERSILRLSPEHYRRLLLLSVHRKNFEQAVFQLLCDGKREESRQLAHALVAHFLLKHVAGWYSVQAVVREIGLAHLKDHESDFKQAHARAAEYYVRPLKSRDVSGFNSRLVNSFAEARYHLYHAGRNEELRQLLVQMMDVALAEMSSFSPVPGHPDVLNERIGILTILLENDAPGGLHYYMARCLRARNKTGDLQSAITHARISTSGRRAPADNWVLLAQLLEQSGDKPRAIDTIYKALDSVPMQDKRFSLYHYGGALLASDNRSSDALILLQEGILNVPAEKNVANLYAKAADLYMEQDRAEMAIGLLQEGIRRVPAKHNLIWLYRGLTQAFLKEDRVSDANDLLHQAIANQTFDGVDLEAIWELQKTIPTNKATPPLGRQAQRIEPILHARENGSVSSATEKEYSSKRILVMATEWTAKQGGLSTFNRELCTSLANLGHEVICIVPEAQPSEVEAAGRKSVRLKAASRVTGADAFSGLMRKLPLDDFVPDVVVGHGRITGYAAKVQQEDSFPDAKRVHFVHMAPGEIEWYKGKEDAAQTAEQREAIELNLCKGADLVAAVGPRLHLECGNLLAALEPSPKLHQYTPGLHDIVSRSPPPGILCLVLGRAEDMELKGLDIAALAMAKLLDSGSEFESPPELVVRGAPLGTGTSLRDTLRKLVYPSDLSIRVKEYSADVDAIEQDLRRASVLLMPSRREGFGLVSLEALQVGTPILVSNKSGFAEFLKTKITSASQFQQYVVRTVDDCEESADEWCKALDFVLRDRNAAFKRTVDLQKIMDGHTWEAASAELLSALFAGAGL
ncbi:Glycosyltransferase involved in cell wall bisynthesis [Pseudomonas sp. NFACC15-1]|uniref:glycosyltransferase n=1 Tax=unclassified Pseudomonas TaxID=196821 RepID=UPI00087F912E|nr:MULTISPECIES: glycosyltransferase [unclassified Pseudomonas]SDA73504.1 Glycosyltransferase involved in cell wall bisynthesis [Pseudomonas sp. NFACC15-1]SDY25941.1 Glycosyltransferase involved in cell wall bisynthesis [Pseudomonas sp. NFACC14]